MRSHRTLPRIILEFHVSGGSIVICLLPPFVVEPPMMGVDRETGLTRCPESRTLKSLSGYLSGDLEDDGALFTCWTPNGP